MSFSRSSRFVLSCLPVLLLAAVGAVAQDDCVDLTQPGMQLLSVQEAPGVVTAMASVGDTLYLGREDTPWLLAGAVAGGRLVFADSLDAGAATTALAAAAGRLAVGTAAGGLFLHVPEGGGTGGLRPVALLAQPVTALAWHADTLAVGSGDTLRLYLCAADGASLLDSVDLAGEVTTIVTAGGQWHAVRGNDLVRLLGTVGAWIVDREDDSMGSPPLVVASGDLVYSWISIEEGCEYYPYWYGELHVILRGQTYWRLSASLIPSSVMAWSAGQELLVPQESFLHLTSLPGSGQVRELGGLRLPFRPRLLGRVGDAIVAVKDDTLAVVDASQPYSASFSRTGIARGGSEVALGEGGLLWRNEDPCGDLYTGFVDYGTGHATTLMHAHFDEDYPHEYTFIEAIGEHRGILHFTRDGIASADYRLWIDLSTGARVALDSGPDEGRVLAVCDRYALFRSTGTDSLLVDSLVTLAERQVKGRILPAHAVDRRTFAGDRLLVAAAAGSLTVYDLAGGAAITTAWSGDLGHPVDWMRCRGDLLLVGDRNGAAVHLYRLAGGEPVPAGVVPGDYSGGDFSAGVLYLVDGEGFLTFWRYFPDDTVNYLGRIADSTVAQVLVTGAGILAVSGNRGLDDGNLWRVGPPCGVEVPVMVAGGTYRPQGRGWLLRWELRSGGETPPLRVVACDDRPHDRLLPVQVAERSVSAVDPAPVGAALYRLEVRQGGTWQEIAAVATPAPSSPGLQLVLRDADREPGTWIHLAGATRRALPVKVYDLRGRLVRALAATPDGGQADVLWNWRDTTGRRVGAGVYLVRVRDGAGAVSGKILVTR